MSKILGNWKTRWGFLILVLGLIANFISWQFFSARPRSPQQETQDLASQNRPSGNRTEPVSAIKIAATPTPDAKMPPRQLAALPPAPLTLFDFLKKADGKAKWTLTKTAEQRIVAIGGGVIKFPTEDVPSKGSWVERLAGWSGIPAEQIDKTETPLPETAFSRTTQYQQVYQGYLVDQSFIRISERKSDGGIFYSQIETKNIGEPDFRIAYSLADAKSISLKHFENRTGVALISVAEKPVIYVTTAGQSELAWKLAVKITGPLYEERRILVSAKSGSVLVDVPSLQF